MRLIGKVNGVDISFDFYPPNQFRGEVPKNLTGAYIVQLQAVDDGGNTTEYSSIIIKIDFDSFKIEILPSTYIETVNDANYSTGDVQEAEATYQVYEIDNCLNIKTIELVLAEYATSEVDSRFSVATVANNYTYKELV
jgi:hypothetical protein